MFRVVAQQMIAPNVHLLTLDAPDVAREAKAGQFVILRPDPEGERIPLTLSDWDPELGTITVIFLNIGTTTERLASLRSGQEIPTVVGPLGQPSEIGRHGTVLGVGGCYGIGALYPIARALKEKGNRVILVIEARSAFLMYWEARLRGVCDRLLHITRDGTRGVRGHVGKLAEIIPSLGEPVNRVYINGCTLLMKRGADVTRPLGLETVVALNPIMIDGTGMCGVCRVTVGGATRFACVNGPEFNGHDVDWAELLQRRKTYIEEEVVPLRRSGCSPGCHGA